MKNNNKGFSLMELIVTFAILSVLAVGVCMFISTCTELYKRVNAKTKLQLNEQIVSQQIENLISPCVKFVKSGDTYKFITKIEDTGNTEQWLVYSSSAKTLKYRYVKQGSKKTATPLLSGITSFKVTPYNQNGTVAVGENLEYVIVEFTLNNSGITVSKKQVINCMNKPVYSAS